MIFKSYPGLSKYMIAPDGYAIEIENGSPVPFQKDKPEPKAILITDEKFNGTNIIRRYTSKEIEKMYNHASATIIGAQKSSKRVAKDPTEFTIK